MNFKIKKNVFAKIYFNQVKGCLLLNGRSIKSRSIQINIINNLLNSLSISVNILLNKPRNKNIIITSKLLLEISEIIKIITNNRKKYLTNRISIPNKEEIINRKESFSIKGLINLRLIIIIILFLFFIIDYRTSKHRINESNILEIKKLENDYKINKCDINGDLPALKLKCETISNKIEVLNNKTTSTLSVFSFWGTEPIYNIIKTYEINNSIIILIFLLILYKII